MTTTATVGTPATLNELSGSYTVDAAHTRVGFVARHAMVTKVRGAFNEVRGLHRRRRRRPGRVAGRTDH